MSMAATRGLDLSRLVHSIGRLLLRALSWFTAFRRTRPFWGSVWLFVGGIVVLRTADIPLGLVLGQGFSGSAGYILGGGMMLFAAVAMFAPHYHALVGLVGVLLALAAFVSVNLGGFLVGTVLGIVGGSMVWGWGEKRPRPEPRQRRRRSPEQA